MTRLRLAFVALAFALAAGPVQAACYADYRASMDNPLRLHYGVIELPQSACSMAAAPSEIARRIAASGWELLQVISVFDDAGLNARRADAGNYYLRF